VLSPNLIDLSVNFQNRGSHSEKQTMLYTKIQRPFAAAGKGSGKPAARKGKKTSVLSDPWQGRVNNTRKRAG